VAARKGPPAPDPYPIFTALLRQLGAPAPVREHPVCFDRKFRLDYAWPDHGRLAVEVEGGLWSKDRTRFAHSTPTAIQRDMEKNNLCVLNGWRVLRFTPEQLPGGVPLIVQLLTGEGNKNATREAPPGEVVPVLLI
jgi:hypothetical protein